MKTPDSLAKELVQDAETGEWYRPRYMTVDEIKERDDLNIANTASAMRARVIAYHRAGNGRGSIGGVLR